MEDQRGEELSLQAGGLPQLPAAEGVWQRNPPGLQRCLLGLLALRRGVRVPARRAPAGGGADPSLRPRSGCWLTLQEGRFLHHPLLPQADLRGAARSHLCCGTPEHLARPVGEALRWGLNTIVHTVTVHTLYGTFMGEKSPDRATGLLTVVFRQDLPSGYICSSPA